MIKDIPWCQDEQEERTLPLRRDHVRVQRPRELARSLSLRELPAEYRFAVHDLVRRAYRFTGKQPSVYRSSPGVRRLFCANCGTPMAYESDRYPDETHFYAASLADSRDFAPQFHVHWAERVPWVELADDLPRHEHSSD